MIDFYIHSINTNEAIFEYWLDELTSIKSVTLKSISFYNSWWTRDIGEGTELLILLKIEGEKETAFIPERGRYNINDVCSFFNKVLKARKIDHVKMSCDQNNYIILELIEQKKFEFTKVFNIKDDQPHSASWFNNDVFGFSQTSFDRKGKYYSTKPLLFYRTELFFRSNLVYQKNTLYNNKPTDILCIIPVEDGEQIKHQRHEPMNCSKIVNKTTNHLKFEITDEKGKLINFRGTSMLIHLQLQVFLIINE